MAKSRKKKKKIHTQSKSRYLSVTSSPDADERPYTDGTIKFLNKYGLLILCVFVLAYIVIYGYTSYQKYESFSYYDFDLAIYNQVTWNTLHGNFMYSSIRENVYNMDGAQKRIGIYFKDHAPVILLLFLPVYAIFQTPLTLLMLQTIFLGGAAVPLYLIARRELHGGWGLVYGLVYLFYPAVGYINLFEFHPLCFVPFFLLFAFYFYRLNKFWPFVVFLVLAMFCKEEVAITVFMFGVYVLIDRARKKQIFTSKKWIISPSVIGLLWAIITFKILAPMFNERGYIYEDFYREMGGSMGGIIKTALTRPIYTIKFLFRVAPDMMTNKPLFLVQIFLPVLFLSFLSPLSLLIIIPQLFLYLCSSYPNPARIYFQYTGAIIPIIFLSSVLGLKFLSVKIKWKKYWTVFASVLLVAGVVSSAIWGSLFRLRSTEWQYPAGGKVYISDHTDEIKQHMINLVPEDASITATFRFLDKLSMRKYLYSFHYIYMGKEKVTKIKYSVPEKIDYALFDYSDMVFTSWQDPKGRSTEYTRDFIIGRRYGVEKVVDAFVLLKEGKEDLTPLYEVLDEQPKPENMIKRGIRVRLGNDEPFIFIGLIGTDLELIETDGFQQVEIASYWQCISQAPSVTGQLAPMTMYVNIVLVDESNKETANVIAQRRYPICYEIYPTNLWKKDEFVKTKHYIALPPDIEPGKYKVVMQPYPKNAKLLGPMEYSPFVGGEIEVPSK